jgi:DNA-binding winged helix-turn-helix (wHTH) protein
VTRRLKLAEEQTLEYLLFSGAYEAVLARTAQGHSEAEAEAFVGALAFSGRLEEAESAFNAFVASSPLPGHAMAARFFLVAGLCHAGQTGKALRRARESIPQLRSADPRGRFWIFQGLALVRYFEGRVRLARRLARRALGHAIEAGFPYARFLALDLLAHVSIHTGDVFAGLRLLSQSEHLARSLGYAENARTQETSRSVFQLRMLLTDVDQAIAEVEHVVRDPEVSYFTRRNGLVELATMFALAGNASRADEALDEARRIALPGADRRGKTRFLICHALSTALSQGSAKARPILEEARALATGELTLLTELGFVDLIFLGPGTPEARAAFASIAERTGTLRGRIACDVAAGVATLHPARVEDGLGRTLLECSGKPAPARVSRVLKAGLLGLLPWALGREPGRRIVIAASRILTEHDGSVVGHELPSRPSLKLLLELRGGYKSRAALIADVWGIARFVPARHVAVLHTAVSRLRVALSEPDWIVTHDDGYALAEGVEIVTLEDDSTPSEPREPLVPSNPPPAPDDRGPVLALVEKQGSVSSAEVASELGISASSALRVLRALANEGLLVRTGGGRSTRYQPAT